MIFYLLLSSIIKLHNIEEIKWINKQDGLSTQTNLKVKSYMNLK